MKPRLPLTWWLFSFCVAVLPVPARGQISGPPIDPRITVQASEVTFAGKQIDSFSVGDAPLIRVQLDGDLVSNMYLRVLVWDKRREQTRLAFSQVITGDPRPNGTYVISRSELNDLPVGKYLIQVTLNQWQLSGNVTLSLIESALTVKASPPPDPVSPPQDDNNDESSPLPPNDPQAPEDSQTPNDPEVAPPDDPQVTPPNDPEVTPPDGPETPPPDDPQATPPDDPVPPPSSDPKTDVWDLKPRSGQTYRNLIIHGGVRAVWESINNVTFENCDFRDAAVLVTVQAKSDNADTIAATSSSGWTFRNCTFVGATRSDWGHSHGAFLSYADNFLFENCTFENNGWLYTTSRFNQNHHVYLLEVGQVRFENCRFIKAAAQGIKCLGAQSLQVDGCTFSGNLIDIGGDDRGTTKNITITNCNFYDVGGIDSIGQTLGWSLNFEYHSHSLDNVLIQNCRWFGPAVFSNVRAMKFAGGRIGQVKVVDCDLSQFKIDTNIWPKIVNEIGSRLTVQGTIGLD